MRNMTSIGALAKLSVALLCLLLATPALAAEEGGAKPKDGEDKAWSVDLILPYYSKYLSRGALTVDDPVLQPGLTVAAHGFSFNVWGNYNLTDKIER
ncbi:MAG: hypothetical protein HY794_15555, partial [Desulfarculus sp.]|nr:hypothetical protein [Desulfarculus sp.]